MYRLRSRIVNFRVTDEELERLKTASALRGSRCLSDFARSVTLENANAPEHSPAHEACDSRMLSFEQRLTVLESNVEDLQRAAVSPKGMSSKSTVGKS